MVWKTLWNGNRKIKQSLDCFAALAMTNSGRTQSRPRSSLLGARRRGNAMLLLFAMDRQEQHQRASLDCFSEISMNTQLKRLFLLNV